MLAVFTLAVALAMDATAVAAAKGLAVKRLRLGQALRIALLFGAFQGGMPLIGWGIGARFATSIGAWDHWVAFGLLAAIGAKMIYEVIRDKPDDDHEPDMFGWKHLVFLAIATSIDALVAGLTLPMLHAPVVVSVIVIGATTSVLSFGGAYLGRALGAKLGKRLEVFGGVLLIGLGLKILLEHVRP